MNAEILPDEPSDLEMEPTELEDASDLDYVEMPCTDELAGDDDDSRWDVFVADDDEREPEPDSDDFCGDKEKIVAVGNLHISPAPYLFA